MTIPSPELTMTASPSTRLKHVRSFTADDIPQVAELHAKVFSVASQVGPEMLEEYRSYFQDVFLSHHRIWARIDTISIGGYA